MAGIKETKEVVAFAVALGNGLGNALEDGDIDFADVVDFVGVIRTVGDAFEGLSELPGELSDLSEVEYQELKAYVEDEFDIPQDMVEGVVEQAFDIGLKVAAFVSTFFTEPEEETE